MRNSKKHLAIAALIVAAGAAGTALAQTAYVDGPQASPQTSADAVDSGSHILHFRDQGNSPETDPAAHLLLIKDTRPMRAAELETTTTQTTTVADAAPAPTPAPVVAPTDTTSTSATTDTAPTPAISDSTPEKSTADDSAQMPPPRADRN